MAAGVLFLAFLGSPCTAPVQADSSSVTGAGKMDQAALAAFETDVAFLHDYLRIPGLAAGILHDRDLVWFKGYGYADLDSKTPVTPDTPFHLASLTKTFASTLLLRLVEQGRLDLDTPARDFGIDLNSPGTITVRHLFTHTSRGGTPGKRYRYDGSRFGKLDRVIERITGESFGENLKRTIIDPLGLKNTGPMIAQLAVPLASPYVIDKKTGDLVPAAYPTYFGTSAGLVASLADYAQYITAIQDHRFLKPETQALAFTPAKSTKGHDLPYGLGWFVETVKGSKLIWHYGWWDSVSSLVLMVPNRDLTLLAFANTDALSRGFKLGKGKVERSPLAQSFLEHFLVEVK